MLGFITRRTLLAIPVLIGIMVVVFFLIRAIPGDPCTSLLGERSTVEACERFDEANGLNDPIGVQYLNYLKQLAHGDFGPSFKYKDYSVNELLAQSLPVSLEIGLYAFVIALLLGVTLGIIAALKQNSWLDYILMGFAMIGVVIPSFVQAPLLVLIFAITLQWLPAGGWNGGAAINMVLPVTALALAYTASIARIMRSSMIEVLNSPFIRTAKAKGLSMRYIVLKHALRPAMLPVVSYLGPAFVGIITGSIVIETIFGLPGIGQLFVNGALNRDYGMVLSLTILVGVLTIAFNAVVDILYAVIDPKIRY